MRDETLRQLIDDAHGLRYFQFSKREVLNSSLGKIFIQIEKGSTSSLYVNLLVRRPNEEKYFHEYMSISFGSLEATISKMMKFFFRLNEYYCGVMKKYGFIHQEYFKFVSGGLMLKLNGGGDVMDSRRCQMGNRYFAFGDIHSIMRNLSLEEMMSLSPRSRDLVFHEKIH